MDAVKTLRSRGICFWVAVALLSLASCAAFADEKPADKKPAADKKEPAEKKKPVEKPDSQKIVVKGLTLNLPTTWTRIKPKSRFRLAEFEIPPVDGDHEPAEFRVTDFGGGDAKANINRWVKEFEADGRKATAFQGASDGGKYQIADITGTFKKSIGPPIQNQFEVKKGWRVINVRLETEAGLFFLKFLGPDKTVTAAADAVRKSFGADLSKEKDLPIEKSE